jgi:S1-C subfamily serine protease
VHAAWVGAVTATLTPEEARRLDLSPAEEAGLKTGDVITAVAGRPVDSREAFSTATATLAPGGNVQLTVDRGGSSRTVNLRVGDPPSALGLRILEEVAGLRVADERRSVVIDEVIRGSRADEIGITPGDVIVGANGNEVTSTRELNSELMRSAERSSFVLSVLHGRRVYNLTFPMGV